MQHFTSLPDPPQDQDPLPSITALSSSISTSSSTTAPPRKNRIQQWFQRRFVPDLLIRPHTPQSSASPPLPISSATPSSPLVSWESNVPVCISCHKKFSPWRRRYTCSYCSQSYCDACCTEDGTSLNGIMSRICIFCKQEHARKEEINDEQVPMTILTSNMNPTQVSNISTLSTDSIPFKQSLQMDDWMELQISSPTLENYSEQPVQQIYPMRNLSKSQRRRHFSLTPKKKSFNKHQRHVSAPVMVSLSANLTFVPLNEYYSHYLKHLICQLLHKEDISSYWSDWIVSTAIQVSDWLRPLLLDELDIRTYLKIKTRSSHVLIGHCPLNFQAQGSIQWISGVLATQHVAHKAMHRKVPQPRILLVNFSLTFDRHETALLSMDTALLQEREQAQFLVERLLALNPNIILTTLSVSRRVLEALLSHNIVVVWHCNIKVLLAISRAIQIPILESSQQLTGLMNTTLTNQTPIGSTKGFFQVLEIDQKPLLVLDDCPRDRFCSCLIQSVHEDIWTLKKLKKILLFACFLARHLRLESLLLDMEQQPSSNWQDDHRSLERYNYNSLDQSMEHLMALFKSNDLSLSPLYSIPTPFLLRRNEDVTAQSNSNKEITFSYFQYLITNAAHLTNIQNQLFIPILVSRPCSKLSFHDSLSFQSIPFYSPEDLSLGEWTNQWMTLTCKSCLNLLKFHEQIYYFDECKITMKMENHDEMHVADDFIFVATLKVKCCQSNQGYFFSFSLFILLLTYAVCPQCHEPMRNHENSFYYRGYKMVIKVESLTLFSLVKTVQTLTETDLNTLHDKLDVTSSSDLVIQKETKIEVEAQEMDHISLGDSVIEKETNDFAEDVTVEATSIKGDEYQHVNAFPFLGQSPIHSSKTSSALPLSQPFYLKRIVPTEEQWTSLIAYTLNASVYRQQVNISASLEETLLQSTSSHIKYQFLAENNPVQCKVYFAAQFQALREASQIHEREYISSLSQCEWWRTGGGKSGAAFLKTLDHRFLIKALNRPEMEAFLRFAPFYFSYQQQVLFHDLPSILAALLGVYRLTLSNGDVMDVVVMSNLIFYPMRVYDLKGNTRNRHVQETGQLSQVLLDENFIQHYQDSALWIREDAKRFLRAAVFNDTLFLSQNNVMDYSCLVGIDESKQILVVGIIDYMRTFTWDKKLESWVKESGILGGGGKEPTVVSPLQYKTRFREAMERYFIMIPDKWTSLEEPESST